MSAQCEDLDIVLLERFHPQLSTDANWQSKTGLVVEAEDGSLNNKLLLTIPSAL